MATTYSQQLQQQMRGVGDIDSLAYQNLNYLLQHSPVLTRNMEEAIARGELKSLAVQSVSEYGGAASYDHQTRGIELDYGQIHSPSTNTLGTLAFITGHEVQHALNRGWVQQEASTGFAQDAQAVLHSGRADHNYTHAMHDALAAHRRDEASAHIAGWNTLVDYVKHANPQAELGEIYDASPKYASDLIEIKFSADSVNYVPKPGFTLNSDLTITPTAENIEAAGKHYFERSPNDIKLGPHRTADYTNYYAAPLISRLCRLERENPQLAGKLMLDMQGEKLDEKLIEERGVNLDKPGNRCEYYDTSEPDKPRYFDHTIQTNEYRPISGQGGLERDDEFDAIEPGQHLSPKVQHLKDRLDEHLKPKLLEAGCKEHHADAMVAAGVKHCVEQGAEDVLFAGINKQENTLVLATDQKHGMVIYDAIAASKVEPEQTLREAEQLLQPQQQQDQQRQQAQTELLDHDFTQQQTQQQAQQEQAQQQQFLQHTEQLQRVMRMEM